MGRSLETFQVTLAQSNKAFKSFPEMYKNLKKEYINASVSIKEIDEIEEVVKSQKHLQIIKLNSVKFFLSHIFNDETKYIAALMRYFPDPTFAYCFYQIADWKIITNMSSLIFQKIKTNQKIFVPYHIFDSQLVQSEDYNFQWKVLKKDFDFGIYDRDFFQGLNLNEPNQEFKYRIRFLSDFSVDLIELLKVEKTSQFLKDRFKKVIFHIHGGGFVAMSSSIHQTYLRKFVRHTEAVCFSIDYPLAPIAKYKDILNCIINSYIFVISYLKNVVEIDDPEIIFVGDSAGGTLVTALCSWLILNNQKIPKCLLLNYPAVDLNLCQFTPSLLHSFKDFLLNFNMLLLCERCYISEEDNPEKDFMLSPIATPSHLLQKFPKTYILVCEKDPLHDQGIDFGYRLLKQNVPTKLLRFRNMPHGLLNMAFPQGMQEGYQFEKVNIKILRKNFGKQFCQVTKFLFRIKRQLI